MHFFYNLARLSESFPSLLEQLARCVLNLIQIGQEPRYTDVKGIGWKGLGRGCREPKKDGKDCRWLERGGVFSHSGQIYLEVGDLVTFAQGDLEHIHGADKSCQPRQTLLATSTDANQQGISSRGLQDSVDVTTEEE